jgi:hypothetical protein
MMRQSIIRNNRTGLNGHYWAKAGAFRRGTGFELYTAMRGMILISLCGLTAAGCASHQPTPAQISEARVAAFEDRPASALVFDLPIDRGMAHPELARANRGNAAFLGFDSPTTESYISAQDTISTELGDFHTDESVTIRSGTRTR